MSTFKAKGAGYSSKGSAQERALDRFAEMMIDKIESIAENWQKPWFTEGSMTWPMNISGRHYNGMNSLMLILHCEMCGYKYPYFCTFDKVMSLNYNKTQHGKEPAKDKDGNKLPMVSVKKGEKSFPVFLTCFTVVNKYTNEKIKYEDYKLLSDTEKDNYLVFPKLQVYNVFNIEQTNIEDARPELFKKIVVSNSPENFTQEDEMFHFKKMDKMIAENLWICPINLKYGDKACYSISKKEITLPEFKQFKNGEAFYGNAFHEMAHSTGAEEYLNRTKPAAFGSPEYAKEELVAELTAAMVAQYYGIEKYINEDSAAYLKSWLSSLKEDAKFIKTILLDVKRASAMITKAIDEVDQA